MRISTNQYSINLVSIICTVLSFMLLLIYWNEFTINKKMFLMLLILLFVIVMKKNSSSKQILGQKRYLTVNSPFNRQSQSTNDKVSIVSNYLSQLNLNQPKDFTEDKKSQWNRGFTYSSGRLGKIEPTESLYSSYFNKLQQQGSQQIGSKNEIRLFIPQNLTSIFQEIKERVAPNKHLKNFCIFIQDLKDGKATSSKQTLLSYCSQSQSLILDENKNLLLEQQYDIIIRDETYLAQIVCDYLETNLETILTQANSNFRTVSQMVMKLFGMKVNFYINQRNFNDSDQQDVSITQLREFLLRLRKDSFIPQKFKPTVPIKDFMKTYYDRLLISTEAVVKFLQFNQKDEQMALRLYIQVLNQEFSDDKIVLTRNLSSLSEETKKIKHTFFVHKLGHEVSFTYSRIKKFVTTNPLVVVIAYFAQDHKTGIHRNFDIVKSLNKFFKQKSRLVSSSKK